MLQNYKKITEKCYKYTAKTKENVTGSLEILWKNVNMNVRKGNPNIRRA